MYQDTGTIHAPLEYFKNGYVRPGVLNLNFLSKGIRAKVCGFGICVGRFPANQEAAAKLIKLFST